MLKKISWFVMVIALMALTILPLSNETQAQPKTFDGAYCVVNFGTLANSVSETQYVVLPNWVRLDSITVSAYGVGEVDVDSIDIYPGGGNGAYSSTALTAISTIDLADGVAGWQNCATNNATVLTGAALRSAKMLKLTTRGATSGNDATDPNSFSVGLRAYGQVK